MARLQQTTRKAQQVFKVNAPRLEEGDWVAKFTSNVNKQLSLIGERFNRIPEIEGFDPDDYVQIADLRDEIIKIDEEDEALVDTEGEAEDDIGGGSGRKRQRRTTRRHRQIWEEISAAIDSMEPLAAPPNVAAASSIGTTSSANTGDLPRFSYEDHTHGGILGAPVAGGVAGQVLFFTSTFQAGGDVDFTWDSTNNVLTLGVVAAATGTVVGGTSASANLKLLASSSGSAHTGFLNFDDAQTWWPDVPDPDAINSGFTVAKFTPAITDTTASSAKRLILFDPTFTVSASTSITGSVDILDVAGTWNQASGFNDNDTLTIVNFRSAFNNAGFPSVPGPRSRRIFWDQSVTTSTGSPTDAITLCRIFELTPTFTASGAAATLYIGTQNVGLRLRPTLNALTGGLISGSDMPEQASFNAVRLDAPALNTSGGGVIDIGVYCGLTCSDYGGLTGISIPLSLRSLGLEVEMRHAGPGIFGANAARTNASVCLEAQSTTRCFLNARMTTAQQVTMTGVAVANGMQFYDSTLNKMQFRENGAWVGFITTGTASTITVQEDDVTVDAAVTTLDFTEPDATLVTSSPAGEANIAMNKYALLAGRSGGQTLIGGTAANEILTLQSTSNSTRGTVDVERTMRIHTGAASPTAAGYTICEMPLSLSLGGTTPNFRGLFVSGTATYSVAPSAISTANMFNFNPTIVNVGNLAMSPVFVFSNNVVLSPASASTTTAWAVRSLNANPTLTAVAGGGTAAATDIYAVRVQGTYNGGWTITDAAAVKMLDPAGTPAGLTRLGCLEIDDLTKGTSNYSLWSKGASVFLAHGGPALFGASQSTLTAPAANVKVDIAGGLALRAISDVTLVNGANTAVDLGNQSFVRIVGPTAAFTIHGVINGVNGKFYIIYNTVAFNMTIADQSATEGTAANRIITMSGANISTTAVGAVMLIYDATQSRWICFHLQA